MIPKVASWKEGTVGKLTEVINLGGTFGIIDVHGVPANSMLGMRETLRPIMSINVSKKKLLRRAWTNAGKDTAHLDSLLEGAVQPALIQSSEMNSFDLFRELKKTEAGRAAKPGDIAPIDIIVEKQDTEMPPGPIVGELNSVGIPAKIAKGSVLIQKEVVALKAGEVFEGELGMLLGKIGINPIVTGLRLCGSLEDDTLFSPEILNIDTKAFEQTIIGSAAGAFNLACNLNWYTTQTMPTLVSKASSEAMAVALEAAIANSETLPVFIARAQASALGLAGNLDSSAFNNELQDQLGAAESTAASAADTVVEETETTPVEVEEEE